MATESDINKALLDDVYAIYSQAETEMLEKVAKRVAKGITTEGWNEKKLAEVQKLRADISDTITKKLYKGQGLISEDIISAYTKGQVGATIDAGKKAKGISSVDTSGLSEKLQKDVKTAFDYAKGMSGLPQDPDNMFKKVVYADSTMEAKMLKANAGAQVIGDTIYVCKPLEKYVDDEFIMHEIGHKVTKHGTKVSKETQAKAAQELADKLGYKSVKEMASKISPYAMKNPEEFYPEVLMEYYKSLKTGVPLSEEKKKIVQEAVDQMYNDDGKKKKIHDDVGKFAKGIHTTILDELDIPMNLKQLILATNKLLNNASFQILRNAEDAYTQIMANATTGLLAGTDTRIQASQKMLNEMSAKGITSFVDKAGRNWSLSAYAEMCARTVSAHAALQGHIDRQQELGEDLVRVSSIGTTCPICQRWQGVVLSISGKHLKYKGLEVARADGLFHPNCKHTITMFIPDLDGEGKVEPNVVDPESQTYKRNKLIEQQRANERKIRYWKDRAAVALTPEEKTKAMEKVKYWQHTNLLHCAKNDLRRQYAREKTYTGKTGGPMGAPIGGHLKEFEGLYKEVIGANPKEAYSLSQKLYGMKEVTFEKWLKDEVVNLDQLDIDKAQMKDASNKAVTPTSLYKKYIGDNPMQDYAAVSPYEKGTKEFKSSYAKWLKQQIEEIGVSYKVKPKYVEVHEDIPEEDKKLSATNIYKKYYNKAPTEAYKELGGEAGTGMKYGKWVETQKKELIKNGITKTVPFENAQFDKTAKVVTEATKVVDDAKKLSKDMELANYQLDLNINVTSAYKASQFVKKAYKEASEANLSGDKEAFELAMKKYEAAKEKDLEMVKIKATKNMIQDELAFKNEIEALWDAVNNTNDSEITKHIKDKIKIYEDQLAKIKAKKEAEEAAKKAAQNADPLAKYDKLESWELESLVKNQEKVLNGDPFVEHDLNIELKYLKNALKDKDESWYKYEKFKQKIEATEEALKGTLGKKEFTIPGVKPKGEIKNKVNVSQEEIQDKIFDLEMIGAASSKEMLVAGLKIAIDNLENVNPNLSSYQVYVNLYSTQVEAFYSLLENFEEKATAQQKSGPRRRDVVTLGREVRVNVGRLVKQRELYQEVNFQDLENLAGQVSGHDLFAAKLRRDILGRDQWGHNHHQGHDVRLKSGLTKEQQELGKAFQVMYNDYLNKATCKQINQACLDMDNAPQKWKEAVYQMDKAIASCELAESVQTHRFISDEVMKAMFGTLNAHDVELGSLVHSKAFMSATVQGHGLYAKTCDNMLTILTDKGTHVLPSMNYEEGEFVYPRNGKLEVVEIIDHTKKGKKMDTFKDGKVEFKGREIVVRFIEEQKAQDYEMVTPEKIDEMLGKDEIVKHHTKDSKDWIKSLNSEERQASDRYTGSWFTRMNDVYRRNKTDDKTVVDTSYELTSALRRAETTKPVVLRRGCNPEDLAHMLGFKGDFSKVESHWDEINEGGYAAEDKGFLSTSPYASGGFSKNVELRIYCPTGTHAAYVDSISTHRGEKETLLQSGSIYRVVQLKKEGYRTIAYIELLGTD